MGGLEPEVVEQAGEIPRLVLDRVPSRGAGRGVTATPVVRDEVEVRREGALPLAPLVLFGIEDGPREAGEAAMNEDPVARMARADEVLAATSWDSTWDEMDALIQGVVAGQRGRLVPT